MWVPYELLLGPRLALKADAVSLALIHLSRMKLPNWYCEGWTP